MAKSRNSRPRKSSSSSSHAFFTLLFIFSLLLLLLSIFILGVVFSPSFSLHASSSSATVRSINSILRKKLILRNDEDGDRGSNGDGLERWSEVISWEPRAFIYHNFLSKAECEHLIKLAEPTLEKSTVVHPKTGKSVDSRLRTSYGTFLDRHQDVIVSSIEKRIAEFTFIPEENGESIQVLRYEIGQYYVPHSDYFDDKYIDENGGQRVATVLMYLSNVEEGGETVFPFAKGNFSVPRPRDMLQCPEDGIVVKPKMGDALLFWSMKPDGTPDGTSIHGGCSVIKGTKWSATKWLRFYTSRD